MPLANQNKPPVILLVDGMNVFLRGYAANSAISAHGEHVGGVVSFLYTLRKFFTTVYPAASVVVVWDGVGGSVRRLSIFKEYKQGRKTKAKNRFYEYGQESNSLFQQDVLKQILSTLPVRQLSVSDCEADDVISWLGNYWRNKFNTIIMSTDKDYYQLICDKVVVYNPVKSTYIKYNDVVDRFKIIPENFAIARAFIGDPSDNLSGIRGIGFKNISKYISNMDHLPELTLSSILEDLKKRQAGGKPSKIVAKAIEEYDTIERNYKVMRLDHTMLSQHQINEIKYCMCTPVVSDSAAMHKYVTKYGVQISCNALHTEFIRLKYTDGVLTNSFSDTSGTN